MSEQLGGDGWLKVVTLIPDIIPGIIPAFIIKWIAISGIEVRGIELLDDGDVPRKMVSIVIINYTHNQYMYIYILLVEVLCEPVEAIIPPMCVAPLVLPAFLVEPLKFAGRDVPDDPGRGVPLLHVGQDAVQPGKHLPWVRHVRGVVVGLVPQVGVQADQRQVSRHLVLVKTTYNIRLKNWR